MRRIAGETIARRILRDDDYDQARKVLVRQVGGFAAGLHALEVPGHLPAADPLSGLAVANPRYFDPAPPL